jgi:hypothetical protein
MQPGAIAPEVTPIDIKRIGIMTIERPTFLPVEITAER